MKAKNPPILELGKYAKLKGLVDDPSLSLHALAGVVLRKSFSIPHITSYPVSVTSSSEQSRFLFEEIDCQWQIYLSLSRHDSFGLPLQPIQAATHGQLVTLVQGCKPIAEGSIVGQHNGYLDAVMDDQGHTKRINVSASRSLVQISKMSKLTHFYFCSDYISASRFLFRGQFIHCTSRPWNKSSPMAHRLLLLPRNFIPVVKLLLFDPLLSYMHLQFLPRLSPTMKWNLPSPIHRSNLPMIRRKHNILKMTLSRRTAQILRVINIAN